MFIEGLDILKIETGRGGQSIWGTPGTLKTKQQTNAQCCKNLRCIDMSALPGCNSLST